MHLRLSYIRVASRSPRLALLLAVGCSSLTVAEEPDGQGQVDAGAVNGDAVHNDRGAEDGGVQGGAEVPTLPMLPPWEKLIDVGRLHQIRISVAQSDVATLETLHGADVPCKFLFDDVTLKCEGIHQKGAPYSGCRCLRLPCTNPSCKQTNPTCTDAQRCQVKPGLTVSFDADTSSLGLSGLKKLVLNNAHQDLSFVNVHTVYELYRRAGLPAPHTAFAQVVINSIPQGLYVVEEEKDKQLLQRNFGRSDGNLYEGVNIDFAISQDGPGVRTGSGSAELDLKNEKSEMRTRDDLYTVSRAILGSANTDFEANVSKLLDLDGYISGWAIDAVTNVRDNFTFNLNNYLLYDNPTEGRFVFIPHGPDESLGLGYPSTLRAFPPPKGTVDGNSIAEVVRGLLPQAVEDIPALYDKYRAAVARVSSPPVWDTGALLARIAQLADLLETAKPDPKMNADINQFQTFRPTVEAFIKAYGTSRNPPQKPAIADPSRPANRVPVIVSTDLFYPPTPTNLDDLFDVAILASMPEVDLEGIVLDNALKGEALPQLSRPGAIVVSQLETILRRRTPGFVGLGHALTSLDDRVLDDPARFQGGVAFIIETLKRANRPVTIVSLGSLRDVAAAFNREPALFRQRLGKLMVFAGEAATTPAGLAGTNDYNVELDHFAFASVMKSGLPIYWIPREDGGQGPLHPNNAGHSSSWTAPLGDALGLLSGPPMRYFLNDLGESVDYPVGILFWGDNPTLNAQLFKQSQDLYASAVLAAIADKTVTSDGTQVALADGLLQPPAGAVFSFSPVDMTVSERGYVTSYGPAPGSRQINRFNRRVNQETYARAMTVMTGKMLTHLMP